MAGQAKRVLSNKGLHITRHMLDRFGMGDVVDVAGEPGRIVITPIEQDSRDRVMGLLSKWQQEYGLPSRPDGKTYVSVAELMARWDAEDALLTPAEVEAEQRLWDDIVKNRHPIEI
jgi:hypothetical protein